MKIIREIRNELEHKNGFLKIKDFDLQSNLKIVLPTIELNKNGIILPRTLIISFVDVLLKNLMTMFEEVIANLCEKGSLNNVVN